MPRVAALVFADEFQATRAAGEVERRAADLELDPDAFATIVCERDGSYLLTTTRQPRTASHWSSFWSAAFEAITNRETAVGFDRALRDQIAAALRPGCSALLMAIDPPPRAPLLQALGQYGGELLGCADAGS